MIPLLLLACAWQVPLDPDAQAVGNVIEGTVVASGAPADAYVLLFDADDPPPPDGVGSPVDFAAVPAERFNTNAEGLLGAPFALTGVPDGDWLVTVLIDVDADFQPLLDSNAGATCGDAVGGYLASLDGTELAPVHVAGDQRVQGVTLLGAVPMTTERPAFRFATNTVERASTDPQIFTLDSLGVYSEVVELTGPFDGTDACDTAFWVMVMDEDGDGVPDPHPTLGAVGDGALNIWPRVYLQYTGEGDVSLDAGEGYVAEALIYPDFEYELNQPQPLTSLDLLFVPAASHTLPAGDAYTVQGIELPAGAWSVTLVSFTGQTWTVPNDTAGFPATDASFEPATQAGTLQVQ